MTQKNLLQSAGDGTAVPSGYVGENGIVVSSGGAPNASGSYKNLAQVTLQPGIWIVTGSVYLNRDPANSVALMVGAISTQAANIDPSPSWISASSNIGSAATGFSTPTRIFNISTPTSVYLLGRIDYTTAGTTTWSSSSILSYVRIA